MTERAPYSGRRDVRFVTTRRGGTLDDDTHRLLAVWSADCAARVLELFERDHPGDGRPRAAIEQAYAWARGEITMTQAREAAYGAHDAARRATGAAREAARAAGHAVATAHMADHELGGAAYAIRAVRAAAAPAERDEAGSAECRWQRAHLPEAIRELVLDDMRLRKAKFGSLFDCTAEDVGEARAPIASLLSKSEKAQQKVAPGTWQHTMLEGNIRALRIALPLIAGGEDDAAEPTADDLQSALEALDSMIERVENTQTKFPPGTSQHSLQRNRLNALRMARSAVMAKLASD